MDIVSLFVLCLAVAGLAGVVAEILHHDAKILLELADVQAFAAAEPPLRTAAISPEITNGMGASEAAALQA